MKNLLVTLAFLLTYILTSFATHNVGGIITYRHISGNTYEGTITTYISAQSPADAPELELFWGDGTSDTLPRISNELITPDIRINIYTGTHTYSSTGHYILHIEDPNRNAGVMNIPNSINVPFYLETELITSNLNTENNSVLFSGIPIFELTLDAFSFNMGFYDPDGDILTYELITPGGLDGFPIPGYTLPSDVSVNHVTGQLEWAAPTQIGKFVFAILVTECRNGETVGTAVFDLMYTVANSGNAAIQFQNLSAWNMDNNGNYSYVLQPNQSFTLPVTVANATELTAFGEPFISPNAATFTVATSVTDKLFEWQPSLARCSPYTVIFRGISANSEEDVTVLIYVRNQNMDYCDTICNNALSIETISANTFNIFPNPATSEITVSGYSPAYLKLCNAVGQTVAESKNNKLYVGNLSQGLYVLQVFDANGQQVKTEKVIVAK